MSWFFLFLRLLLLPFAWLYGFLTDIRNILYDKSIFKFQYFEDVFTISVGNLTVGGTGKTPHIEFLVRYFQKEFKIATLSRGYGRATKGFREVSDTQTPQSVGDEPWQLYEKFGSQVPIYVCEKRAVGVAKIMSQNPETQLILLDDAFQHRALKTDFQILLTDYERLFYKDFPFPAGWLRENRKQAQKATCVVVSKCPENISEAEKNVIKNQISHYVKPETPIFFSKIVYGIPQNIFTKKLPEGLQKVVVFSGIAQSATFEQHCRQNFEIMKVFSFSDHFNYQQKNIAEIIQNHHEGIVYVTTEKDSVKIRGFIPEAIQKDFFFVPIEVSFLETEPNTVTFLDILGQIKKSVSENRKNRTLLAD